MNVNRKLDLVEKYINNLSNNEDEKNELYIFISQNSDQFFEISERMVIEIKKIKDATKCVSLSGRERIELHSYMLRSVRLTRSPKPSGIKNEKIK